MVNPFWHYMKVGSKMVKLDRRREYFLILDCETACLPHVADLDPAQRKTVGISKPLIYDIGWTIIDRQGRTYDRKNFLISEIFSVPAIFDTAYYANKRPLYLEKLQAGEIILTDWRTATKELEDALNAVKAVGAYNAAFDFKKAIPFTELYINKLYSPDFHDWLDYQNYLIDRAANGSRNKRTTSRKPADENEIFRFRGGVYPLFDIWALACEYIMDSDEYRDFAMDEGWVTDSGKYYKTSAEVAYRFLSRNREFMEAHTALDDAEIESEILASIIRKDKKKLKMGIVAFPFRIVGTVR